MGIGEKLDEAVLGRWMRTPSYEPRGRGARELWAQLRGADHAELRKMAQWGRVADDPRNALVVADLADQFLEKQWRGAGWLMVLTLVIGLGTAVLAGEIVWTAMGGFIGATLGTVLGLLRLDRGRRANLRKAQDAGLI